MGPKWSCYQNWFTFCITNLMHLEHYCVASFCNQFICKHLGSCHVRTNNAGQMNSAPYFFAHSRPFHVFIRFSYRNCIQVQSHKKDSVVKFPHYLIVLEKKGEIKTIWNRKKDELTIIVVDIIVAIHFQLNGTIRAGPTIDTNAFIFTVLKCTLSMAWATILASS